MSSGAIRQTFNKPFVQSSQQLKFKYQILSTL